MASVNNCVTVVGESLEMSRDDTDITQYPKLDWDKIESLTVYDEYGTEIRVGDIYKDKKTILILVRVR